MLLDFFGVSAKELRSFTGMKRSGSGFGDQKPQPSVNQAHIERLRNNVIKSGIFRGHAKCTIGWLKICPGPAGLKASASTKVLFRVVIWRNAIWRNTSHHSKSCPRQH
jgi:hypothetical protein